MHRTLKATALLLAASSLGGAPDAHAIEEANMWGVGVRLGTIAIPGRYPLQFPQKINQYNFIEEGARAGDENSEEPKRDLDENGDQRFTSLERVGFDGQFAIDAFYGLDAQNRIGALAGLGGGGGYSDIYFMVNYDRVLLTESDIDILAGGYLGVGQMTFKDPNDGPEKLRVPHFPVRAHVEAQLRAKTIAVGLGIFGGTNIPSNHYYTDLDGVEQESVGSPFNFTLYLNAGVELTFKYGDFTPPKKKKKGGKKGGKKGKKKK